MEQIKYNPNAIQCTIVFDYLSIVKAISKFVYNCLICNTLCSYSKYHFSANLPSAYLATPTYISALRRCEILGGLRPEADAQRRPHSGRERPRAAAGAVRQEDDRADAARRPDRVRDRPLWHLVRGVHRRLWARAHSAEHQCAAVAAHVGHQSRGILINRTDTLAPSPMLCAFCVLYRLLLW